MPWPPTSTTPARRSAPAPRRAPPPRHRRSTRRQGRRPTAIRRRPHYRAHGALDRVGDRLLGQRPAASHCPRQRGGIAPASLARQPAQPLGQDDARVANGTKQCATGHRDGQLGLRRSRDRGGPPGLDRGAHRQGPVGAGVTVMGGVDVEAVDRVAVPLEEVGGGSDGLEEGGGAIGVGAVVGDGSGGRRRRQCHRRAPFQIPPEGQGPCHHHRGNRCCRPKRVLQ